MAIRVWGTSGSSSSSESVAIVVVAIHLPRSAVNLGLKHCKRGKRQGPFLAVYAMVVYPIRVSYSDFLHVLERKQLYCSQPSEINAA